MDLLSRLFCNCLSKFIKCKIGHCVTLTASNSVIIRTAVSIIPHKLKHNAPGYQLNVTNLCYQFHFPNYEFEPCMISSVIIHFYIISPLNTNNPTRSDLRKFTKLKIRWKSWIFQTDIATFDLPIHCFRYKLRKFRELRDGPLKYSKRSWFWLKDTLNLEHIWINKSSWLVTVWHPLIWTAGMLGR